MPGENNMFFILVLGANHYETVDLVGSSLGLGQQAGD